MWTDKQYQDALQEVLSIEALLMRREHQKNADLYIRHDQLCRQLHAHDHDKIARFAARREGVGER